MPHTVRACVALGANLGDAAATVRHALEELARLPRTCMHSASSLYRSAPHEAQGPDFINAVALIDTDLSADELLSALQTLELQQGRARTYKNAPRTLDLDLIFFGDVCRQSEHLTLPHPRWHERAFVLLPLAEIWPERVSAKQRLAVQDQPIEKI